VGQEVKQGEDFGFIKFGSRVDLFLPMDANIKVQIGEVSTGNKTIIATLN
jgi:phosphatidylserine decarboxylase